MLPGESLPPSHTCTLGLSKETATLFDKTVDPCVHSLSLTTRSTTLVHNVPTVAQLCGMIPTNSLRFHLQRAVRQKRIGYYSHVLARCTCNACAPRRIVHAIRLHSLPFRFNAPNGGLRATLDAKRPGRKISQEPKPHTHTPAHTHTQSHWGSAPLGLSCQRATTPFQTLHCEAARRRSVCDQIAGVHCRRGCTRTLREYSALTFGKVACEWHSNKPARSNSASTRAPPALAVEKWRVASAQHYKPTSTQACPHCQENACSAPLCADTSNARSANMPRAARQRSRMHHSHSVVGGRLTVGVLFDNKPTAGTGNGHTEYSIERTPRSSRRRHCEYDADRSSWAAQYDL